MQAYPSGFSSLNSLLNVSPPKKPTKQSGLQRVPECSVAVGLESDLNHSMDNFIPGKTIHSDDEFQTNHFARNILSSTKPQDKPLPWMVRTDGPELYGQPKPTFCSGFNESMTVQEPGGSASTPAESEGLDDFEDEGSLILNQDVSKIDANFKDFRINQGPPQGEPAFAKQMTAPIGHARPTPVGGGGDFLSEDESPREVYTFQQAQAKTLKLNAKAEGLKRASPSPPPSSNIGSFKKVGQTASKVSATSSKKSIEGRKSPQISQKSIGQNPKSRPIISRSPNKRPRVISEKVVKFVEDAPRPVPAGDVNVFSRIEQYFDQHYERQNFRKSSLPKSRVKEESSLRKSTATDPFVRFKMERLEKMARILE